MSNLKLPLALLVVLGCFCSTAAWSADRKDPAGYVGKAFRIQARADEQQSLRAERVQWRAMPDESEVVQIAGVVRALDRPRHVFLLGNLRVRWRQGSVIRGLRFAELRNGITVRVSGKFDGDDLIAATIRDNEPLDPRTLQITGVVTSVRAAADGATWLGVGELEILWPMRGYNTVESLVRRQDQRGSDNPVTRQLFGRDFGVSGKAEMNSRERRHFDLAGADAVLDSEASFELGAYYRFSSHVTTFIAATYNYTADLWRAGGNRDAPTGRAERDQTWVYFERIGGSGFGLQLGRQNFKEPRSWWWDDDLDAARLYYDRGPLHAELAYARELLPLSNSDDDIAPEQQGITRTLGTVSWLWAPRQKLDLYFLRSADRSPNGAIGSLVASDREDQSDAQLTWFGLRASGGRSIGRWGSINYWLDQAWVNGDERQIGYQDTVNGSRIDSIDSVKVSGTGLDVGLSWQAPWTLPVSLGVSVARGSAGRGDANDGGFRQTGLHRNKMKTFGVNRYRTYGEVLRPELSNLRVETATVGVPFGTNSSLELAWHRYRQLTAARSLRDARIDADLTGASPDVGSALDLVIGIREGQHTDVALTVGFFRAGEAFGANRGATARQIALEATWNF